MTITSKQPKNIVRTLLFCHIHETDSDYNHFNLKKSIATKRYGQEHMVTYHLFFPQEKEWGHEKSIRCEACKAMTKYT